MNAIGRRKLKRAVARAMFSQRYAGRKDRHFARTVKKHVGNVRKIGAGLFMGVVAGLAKKLVAGGQHEETSS